MDKSPDIDGPNRRRAFAVTWLAYSAFYFSRKPFSIAKSTLQRTLALSPATLGLIDSAFLATYSTAQLAIAPVAERCGASPRKMLAAMLAVSAAAALAFSACSSPALLVCCMLLNGTAQSAGYATCMKALMPWLSGSAGRATTLGYWLTCKQTAGLLSTTLAAWALGRLGWRACFALPAALVLGTALLVLACLPIKERVPPCERAEGGDRGNVAAAAAAAAAPLPSLSQVARVPHLCRMSAAYFGVRLVRYTLLSWLPYYMAEELGYPSAVAGYMSTAHDAGGFVGGVVGGWLADGLAGGRSVLVALPAMIGAAALLTCFGAASAAGPAANGLAMAALGLLIAIPDNALGASAVQDACRRHGAGHMLTTALSFVNGVGGMGAMLQGSTTPLLVARFGWAGVWRTAAAACLASAALLLPVARDEYGAIVALREKEKEA